MILKKNNSNSVESFKNSSKKSAICGFNSRVKFELFIFIFFLILQIIFWYKTESIKPNLGIVPEVPTISTVKAFSFGDEEFYFRYKGFRIQNTGDTFGRFSPLKDYDYSKLYEWFKLFDKLNNKSNYIPSLAAYYYSMTQNEKDVIYIINYLVEHADKNPSEKWWWYYQAMTLANNVYKDNELAISIAKKLKDSSPENAPLWTKQMLAILLANQGQNCEALRVITGIIDEYDKQGTDKKSVDDNEMNYMRFFIEKQLKKLKESRFNPKDCYK